MSIVIFEHSCPKCLTGLLQYKSNTHSAVTIKGIVQYNMFICDSCEFGDAIEIADNYRPDEIHRMMD